MKKPVLLASGVVIDADAVTSVRLVPKHSPVFGSSLGSTLELEVVCGGQVINMGSFCVPSAHDVEVFDRAMDDKLGEIARHGREEARKAMLDVLETCGITKNGVMSGPIRRVPNA